MIESPALGWAALLGIMVAASLVGLSLTRLMRWRPAAVAAGIPIAFGFAISPLLLGLATVASLAALPEASHAVHVTVVCALLLGTFVLGRVLGKSVPSFAVPFRAPSSIYSWVLSVLLFTWIVSLLIDAMFLPLTQNDSLEYAIVGRLLFEVRDLGAYPALDPNVGSSGFYGPWTHPPLYVALIYLTNVLQGHADSPGLMRALAPWCALGATALVFTLGNIANRMVGLAAAVLFLSSPLYILGAGSALIDALPVLSLALLLAAVVAVDGSLARRSCTVGLVMGLGLWTHSQAILLIPLGLIAVLSALDSYHPRKVATEVILVLASASILGAWPYVRNAFIFGSAISDNPPVFALPGLDWPAYFSMARGIATWPDKIQYGLFKGWFAVEAYAMLFWLALLGLVLWLRMAAAQYRRILDSLERAANVTASRLFLIAFSIFAAYLGGVAVSIAAGIDLMIRNERYLLMLLPVAALFGGRALECVLHAQRKGWAMGLAKSTLMIAMVSQLVLVVGSRWRELDSPLAMFSESLDYKLRSYAAFNAAAYMRSVPTESVILSARPADMYYSERRMISFIDPRLIPFYREAGSQSAFDALKRLGITHVHVPDYLLPPVYNSHLLDILARPDMSRLLFSEQGYQVYELTRSENDALFSTDISPTIIPWVETEKLVIGLRKDIAGVTHSKRPLAHDGVSKTDTKFPFFLRQRSLVVSPPPLRCDGRPDRSELSAHESVYRLDLELSGRAFAHITLDQHDQHGALLSRTLLGNIAITTADARRPTFMRRFILDPGCSTLSIAIEHRGRSEIRVEKAKLQRSLAVNPL